MRRFVLLIAALLMVLAPAAPVGASLGGEHTHNYGWANETSRSKIPDIECGGTKTIHVGIGTKQVIGQTYGGADIRVYVSVDDNDGGTAADWITSRSANAWSQAVWYIDTNLQTAQRVEIWLNYPQGQVFADLWLYVYCAW